MRLWPFATMPPWVETAKNSPSALVICPKKENFGEWNPALYAGLVTNAKK